MGYIRLTAITWVNPPSSAKVSTVKYKLASAADIPASYTTATTSLTIAVSGDISPDYDITGLVDETAYTVKVSANCGGAAVVQNFTTGAVCPDVMGISGSGNAGAP